AVNLRWARPARTAMVHPIVPCQQSMQKTWVREVELIAFSPFATRFAPAWKPIEQILLLAYCDKAIKSVAAHPTSLLYTVRPLGMRSRKLRPKIRSLHAGRQVVEQRRQLRQHLIADPFRRSVIGRRL